MTEAFGGIFRDMLTQYLVFLAILFEEITAWVVHPDQTNRWDLYEGVFSKSVICLGQTLPDLLVRITMLLHSLGPKTLAVYS
ncbi:hypothetical protein FRB95_009665 [Tulasnella sp. JGI-2019a]|nr:hypothetical protein FRB95_009665 [Tulasnella sp. JGI-2019a]